MKKPGLIISAVAMLFLTAFTTQNLWKSDKGHSELGFSITHLGISDVSGTFNDFEATVSSTKEDFSDAVVEATINVGSISTRIENRDAHLKGPDFFDVEKYPKMTFKSSSIKNIGDGKYKLTGDLTAMEVTKKVELDMVYRGTVENPMTKKPTAGFKISGTIKRSDFGIGSKFPAPMLSDKVHIVVNAEFQE
ncbi:YceI family protein [Yeosuana marina]|uniref:YceI family protein n=1 Tax=Yeosuana marina TaxID=1565536 RepID=UPI0030EDF453|tara:strand:- start:1474 stop:2049 length:576 start_codon:yes stop_codon:yes gene_type:complete